MHQKEMILWHWTSVVWEKVKSGSMARALEDIGLFMPKVIVANAVIRGHTDNGNVNLDVASQLKDGMQRMQIVE